MRPVRGARRVRQAQRARRVRLGPVRGPRVRRGAAGPTGAAGATGPAGPAGPLGRGPGGSGWGRRVRRAAGAGGAHRDCRVRQGPAGPAGPGGRTLMRVRACSGSRERPSRFRRRRNTTRVAPAMAAVPDGQACHSEADTSRVAATNAAMYADAVQSSPSFTADGRAGWSVTLRNNTASRAVHVQFACLCRSARRPLIASTVRPTAVERRALQPAGAAPSSCRRRPAPFASRGRLHPHAIMSWSYESRRPRPISSAGSARCSSRR